MLHLLANGIAFLLLALSGVLGAAVLGQDVTKIAPMAYSYGWAFVACAVVILFIMHWRHMEKKIEKLTDKIDTLYDRIIEAKEK